MPDIKTIASIACYWKTPKFVNNGIPYLEGV